MEAVTIIVRTLLIYFVINVILRVMGKREIGKLSIFDLVISIMIAEAAVFVIEDVKKPIWEGILPMAVLGLTQIVLAFITLKSRKLRGWFEGTPSIIIENGKLNREVMRKQRYSLDDLIMQLRENKIYNVADVEFAILESTGKLSVETREHFRKDEKNQEDKPVNIRYEGLPLALIMDGKVQDNNLKKIGKTRFWLKSELQSRGISDTKAIFLCTIDHRGKLYIDKKMKG